MREQRAPHCLLGERSRLRGRVSGRRSCQRNMRRRRSQAPAPPGRRARRRPHRIGCRPPTRSGSGPPCTAACLCAPPHTDGPAFAAPRVSDHRSSNRNQCIRTAQSLRGARRAPQPRCAPNGRREREPTCRNFARAPNHFQRNSYGRRRPSSSARITSTDRIGCNADPPMSASGVLGTDPSLSAIFSA